MAKQPKAPDFELHRMQPNFAIEPDMRSLLFKGNGWRHANGMTHDTTAQWLDPRDGVVLIGGDTQQVGVGTPGATARRSGHLYHTREDGWINPGHGRDVYDIPHFDTATRTLHLPKKYAVDEFGFIVDQSSGKRLRRVNGPAIHVSNYLEEYFPQCMQDGARLDYVQDGRGITPVYKTMDELRSVELSCYDSHFTDEAGIVRPADRLKDHVRTRTSTHGTKPFAVSLDPAASEKIIASSPHGVSLRLHTLPGGEQSYAFHLPEGAHFDSVSGMVHFADGKQQHLYSIATSKAPEGMGLTHRQFSNLTYRYDAKTGDLSTLGHSHSTLIVQEHAEAGMARPPGKVIVGAGGGDNRGVANILKKWNSAIEEGYRPPTSLARRPAISSQEPHGPSLSASQEPARDPAAKPPRKPEAKPDPPPTRDAKGKGAGAGEPAVEPPPRRRKVRVRKRDAKAGAAETPPAEELTPTGEHAGLGEGIETVEPHETITAEPTVTEGLPPMRNESLPWGERLKQQAAHNLNIEQHGWRGGMNVAGVSLGSVMLIDALARGGNKDKPRSWQERAIEGAGGIAIAGASALHH